MSEDGARQIHGMLPAEPPSAEPRPLEPPSAEPRLLEPPSAEPVVFGRESRLKRHVLRLRTMGPLFLLTLLGLLCALIYEEFHSSVLQSFYFARVGRRLQYTVEPGPSDRIVFPEHGPYDMVLGYALMPKILQKVTQEGYRIASQVRLAPDHLKFLQRFGLYPIYHEKNLTGLTIRGRDQDTMFSSRYPQHTYESFGDIPEIVVKTLLFIENRELLATKHPFKNPTIEWSRLGRAVFDLFLSKLIDEHDVPGGSTLATQIEKYRHSPDGRTAGVDEKLRQMLAASVRAYLMGRNTMEARREIVLKYINSVPLGAVPGGGEVKGLGHGLLAWYGAPFRETNRLLKRIGTEAEDRDNWQRKAQAYRMVLSLFLAQRRPASYLQNGQEVLRHLTDKHLGIMTQAGILSPEFRDAVRAATLPRGRDMVLLQSERLNFVERKGANAVRTHLMGLFGFDRLYTLDRLDLEVDSTIDGQVQKTVTSFLQQLKQKEFAAEHGLLGDRLLARGDPRDVIYSLTIRERVGHANLLRVQADNVDGPFNVNEGGKLELGSTAKLRTLVHYLEVVERLWKELVPLTPGLRRLHRDQYRDRLTTWAVDWLAQEPEATLPGMLDAAMDRRYSASRGEVFFTGGGQHRFSNFNADDDDRVVSVREALQKSINLPFVRIMRDLVQYHTLRLPGAREVFESTDHPERHRYLEQFAQREGREFLWTYYKEFTEDRGADPIRTLLSSRPLSIRRLAAVHAQMRPQESMDGFAKFVREYAPHLDYGAGRIGPWYKIARRPDYGLQDLGYIAGVHPLALWLAVYLRDKPDASWTDIVRASESASLAAYRWLLDSDQRGKQDRRIRIVQEERAFEAIHQAWVETGFPFASLVPTLATALGSSGDKPAALADLMGIINSGGMRYANGRVARLHFAASTPFETEVVMDPPTGRRVLSVAVAQRVRQALVDVVEQGTAGRLKGTFFDADQAMLMIGGKTGTGDNRYSVFAPGGRVIKSRKVSRTATFVFFIGDRFYGTLTAYVPSAAATHFNFTSALPVQILKELEPQLRPLLHRSAGRDPLGAATDS